MPNPLQIAWAYLRGEDLQSKAVPGPTQGIPVSQLHQVSSWSSASASTYVWDNGGVFTAALGGTSGHDGNSAVFACLLALSFAHIEPPLKVLQLTEDESNPRPLPSSPFQGLLQDPNPWHDPLELWFWTQYARHCDGNAYLRKVRAGDELAGNVTELWPVSPALMQPYTAPGSKNFIDYYLYTPPGQAPERIPTQNVIHFRIGIDDRDMRLGLSPIKRLVREIASDDEATRFADALLHNYGVPGLVVQVPAETPIPEDAALALKARLQQAYGTDNRGNVGILTGGATMQQLGFSPEALNLEALHNVPETRIAAVMGVPPAVAGLGVGLAQTSNFASLKQVRENFTEVKLIPTWRLDAAKLNKQLKPDFTNDPRVYVEHDLSRVRALQEDMDALYRRLGQGVQGFWIMPSEARARVGFPADPTLDALWLERAALPSSGGGGFSKATGELETKARLAAEDLPAVYDALLQAGVRHLQPELDRFFDSQRKRVKRALLSNG